MNLLNIGCGPNKITGFINLDRDIDFDPDVLHDLEVTPLPFEDSIISGGIASHILEHITNLLPLVKDLWRITIPSGVWEIRVPHYLSADAWGDPTHVRAFSQQTFYPHFWPGWSLMEMSVPEGYKQITHETVTAIHVKLLRMGEYKTYLPDDSIPEGAIKTANQMSLSEGMEQLNKLAAEGATNETSVS